MLAEEDHSVMCLLLKHAYQVKKSTNHSTFVSPNYGNFPVFLNVTNYMYFEGFYVKLFETPGVEEGGIPNESDTDAHRLASHGERARKKAVRTSAWEATHRLV